MKINKSANRSASRYAKYRNDGMSRPQARAQSRIDSQTVIYEQAIKVDRKNGGRGFKKPAAVNHW